MATLKYTRQREAILENIKHRTDHPTADDVYQDVSKTFPNISLGTVYRNLSVLTDLGVIRRLSTGIGADHYDGNMIPHNHFICQKCGRVYDIEDDLDVTEIQKRASRHFKGQITGCSINFYGTCESCLEKSQSRNRN